MPQAERIAIRVDQIRQRFELVPLGFVMGVFEASRVRPLAGGFDFDKADQQFGAQDGEVGSGLQFGDLRLTDHIHRRSRQPEQLDDLSNQNVQRGPELLLGFSRRSDAGEFFTHRFAERTDRCFESQFAFHRPPLAGAASGPILAQDREQTSDFP